MIDLEDMEVGERVMKDVARILHDRQMQKVKVAERVQRLAASAGGERRTLPNGEVKMMIHPTFYHHWGQRLGYECWEDEQFVREILRDNPECRVKSRSRKIQVGYQGLSGSTKRFTKTYREEDYKKQS